MIRVDCIDGEYINVNEPDWDGDTELSFYDSSAAEQWITYLDAAACEALVAALNGNTLGQLEKIATDAVEAAVNLAAQHGSEIEFRYAKPSGVIETRRLVVGSEGATETRQGYKVVVGHDPDRDEPRSYRLDRMVGGGILLKARA